MLGSQTNCQGYASNLENQVAMGRQTAQDNTCFSSTLAGQGNPWCYVSPECQAGAQSKAGYGGAVRYKNCDASNGDKIAPTVNFND